MQYTTHFPSPLGEFFLAADDTGLTGAWFTGQKYFAATLCSAPQEKETEILSAARRWLTIYFEGREPDFTPPLHLMGSPFRLAVWEELLRIPYGETTTYGAIAKKISARAGKKMSAQAVGGAVGHNPVSVIVPCHRVVGANGSLTGYAGGIDKKIQLLRLEAADMTNFFVPKNGTAL